MLFGRGSGISGRVPYLLVVRMLKRLFTLNKRDWVGLACWLLVSVLIGLLAFPVMVGREIYQYKHYHLSRFEWEDIVRYSLVIIIGSIINYLILGSLL